MDTVAKSKAMSFDGIFELSPVVAVVTLPDAGLAVPVAQALARGGVRTVEITLRTGAGLDSIRRITREVPEVLVGAGTVLTVRDMSAALEAGAKFNISPGSTPALLAAGQESGVPYLPGIGSASELMLAMDHGYACAKIFPIMALGGVLFPRILAGPFPKIRFCANGGLSLKVASELLREPNVHAVGATWMTPPEALAARDFATIEAGARQSVQSLRKE